ncbi:response regulator transcription factor [Miniphocaeibacter massiliensis]|uniref:response regulator transcription factor n=1 Tax=Miniphocaeibacter massiliensis TaxID=2041841 RepID=UPI000C1B91A7|nr:response regulator transcription factor [Miniphocaeibacter massiliensis]
MKYKILVADDEIELLEVLELYFKRESWKIIKAKDGKEALEKFKEADLIVLDIMMPEVDGIKVLQKIREESQVPVIMLTARSQDYDKIIGLDLGADDYITKPYNPMEVVARVRAQLRRNYEISNKNEKLELIIGDLKINKGTGEFYFIDKEVELTFTEFKIITLLMENPNRIFTKEQIFSYVWEDEYMNDENTVMVHISRLRNKIGDRNKEIIKTIKGLGYKLVDKNE